MNQRNRFLERRRLLCECETTTLNRPSPRDPYQPDEQRVPNPLCPVHRERDDARGVDWNECGEFYDLRITNDGEWVDKDDWNEETGNRKGHDHE